MAYDGEVKNYLDAPGIVTLPDNVIAQARALLSEPKRWHVGSYARDDQGQEVDSTSESAVSFCVLGALRRVTGVHNYAYRDDCAPYSAALKKLACQLNEDAADLDIGALEEVLYEFNDDGDDDNYWRVIDLLDGKCFT